jgi:hypothetical protein
MSDSEPNKKISNEFVQSVKKYIEIDDKIREYKEINKNLNTQKKEQEEFILNYLETIEENTIDIKDGTLKRNVAKTQTPIKKDIIQKALTEITGDSIKSQEFTDYIIKSRPVTEKISLRRTTKKGQTEN